MNVDPLVQLAAAGLLAIVFARAIVEKAANFAVHAATLRDYRLLPERIAPVAAAGLLCAEIAVVFALVVPAMRSAGALAAGALLCLYAVAMALALRAGRTEIECGCGGDGQMVAWGLVARNAALIATAGLLLAPASARALGWPDMIEAVCATLVAWLLLATAEKAVENGAAIRRLRSQSFL